MWLGVMIGGALGALARYGLGLAITALTARTVLGGFPAATLVINVAGSFALSLLLTLWARGAVSAEWRTWIGTGFLGAFTTFSTFSVETDELARRGAWGVGSLYVLLSVGLSLLAVLAGRWLAERA